MELKPSVSLDFLVWPVENKIPFGNRVFNKIKNDPRYAGCPIPAGTLDSNNQKLQAAETEALSGDHEKIAFRNEELKVWNHDMKIVATWLNGLADGVESIILGAGFESTKTHSTPGTKPETPANFDGSMSKGSATLSCDDSLKTTACAYMLRTENVQVEVIDNVIKATVGGETFWVVLDTHKETVVPGLPKHVPLFASMMAFNHKGASPVTSEIEL